MMKEKTGKELLMDFLIGKKIGKKELFDSQTGDIFNKYFYPEPNRIVRVISKGDIISESCQLELAPYMSKDLALKLELPFVPNFVKTTSELFVPNFESMEFLLKSLYTSLEVDGVSPKLNFYPIIDGNIPSILQFYFCYGSEFAQNYKQYLDDPDPNLYIYDSADGDPTSPGLRVVLSKGIEHDIKTKVTTLEITHGSIRLFCYLITLLLVKKIDLSTITGKFVDNRVKAYNAKYSYQIKGTDMPVGSLIRVSKMLEQLPKLKQMIIYFTLSGSDNSHELTKSLLRQSNGTYKND